MEKILNLSAAIAKLNKSRLHKAIRQRCLVFYQENRIVLPAKTRSLVRFTPQDLPETPLS